MTRAQTILKKLSLIKGTHPATADVDRADRTGKPADNRPIRHLGFGHEVNIDFGT